MFGNVIYFDEDKIATYTTSITGKPLVKSQLVERSTNKAASIGLSSVKAEGGSANTYSVKSTDSILNEINEFEKKLRNRDDFFDFSTNPNYYLENIHRGNIVKFNTYISVPEMFDIIQTVEKFKPLMTSQVKSSMQKDEADAFQAFFDAQNAKIPVMCAIEDTEVRALIETNYLAIPYEEIEEYEEIEMSVLARTLDNSLVKKDKPFYEPLKHFIKLNRTIRRSMANDVQNELSPIYSDDDYRLIEILAIYG